MKIIVTGASGFVGAKILNVLKNKYSVVGTYNKKKEKNLLKLDVTNKEEVNKFLSKNKPDVIVHTAALVDVNKCEKEPELAYKINHLGTKNIVDYCGKNGVKLIYISTVYVFDGKRGNYTEIDERKAVNVYGKSKICAEEEVEKLKDYAILRSDFIVGYNSPDKKNGFFGLIINNGKVWADNEQIRQPIFADDFALAVEKIIEEDLRGIYHLAGPDSMTKYELGIKLESILGREESHIYPVYKAEHPASRPENVSIIAKKAKSAGFKFRSMDEYLQVIMRQYEKSN